MQNICSKSTGLGLLPPLCKPRDLSRVCVLEIYVMEAFLMRGNFDSMATFTNWPEKKLGITFENSNKLTKLNKSDYQAEHSLKKGKDIQTKIIMPWVCTTN